MKKVILCLLFFAFAGLAHAGTWSFAQGKRTQSCTANMSTCTLSFSSGVAGGAGDAVAVFFASTSTSTPSITISSATIGSNSFTLLSGSTCAAQVSGAIFDIDCAYIINPTAGGTSVTLTLSQAPSSVWYMSIVEVQNTGSAWLDIAGNAILSTDSTSAAGPSLTLSGSNDAILQSLRGSLPSAISGGYTNALGTFTNGIDTAYLLNTNSGVGPTWTQGSSKAALDGIAFKDSNAQLPTHWAASKGSILVPSYDVTKTLGTGMNYSCSTAAQCFASLQQAYCDWVAAPDQNWLIKITHGTLLQTGTAVKCTQTGATTYRSLTLLPKIIAGALPAKFIVFDSDTPLPEGTTVCARAVDSTALRQDPTGDISTWWTGSNYGCGNDRPSMWTLEGNWIPGNAGMLIQAGPYDTGANLGAANVIFKNVELRPITTNTSSIIAVNLDAGSIYTRPTLTSQMPSNIHFINFYAHGDATAWCNAPASGVAPCINPLTPPGAGGSGNNRIADFLRMTDCKNCSATYYYMDWIISLGAENHLISMPRGPGPFKVAQGFLSSASSTVFSGGESFTDPLYSVFDLQITSNYVTTPVSWVGANFNGTALTLKNRMELKACQRCVVEGNTFEYQDTSGGQEGQLFTLTPRNCSGGSICNNYTGALQDITFQKNIGRHALVGVSMAGSSSYSTGNGGGASPPLDHVTIQKNLFYDLGSAFYDPNKNVTSPFFFRTTTGSPAFVCSGTNAAGTITLTCDGSVIGLQQTQIRPGDTFTVTSCSTANWNFPAVSTNVWQTTKGATALSGTTPAGLTIVYSNPSATGATATGCVVQQQGAPYHLLVQHNTVVMQTDAYPSGCGIPPAPVCSTTKNLSGAASITGGQATVTISGTPIVVPNTGKVNVVGANITAYNCTLCLATATTTSPNTVTYQTTFGNRAGDTLTTGQIQQPPNNGRIYNGSSAVNIYTDTGCTGAGPNNSTAITAWRRASNVVYATLPDVTAWPAAIGATQILVEVSGSGTANGLFYYQGRNVAVTGASEAGTTATIQTVLNPGVGATVVVANVGTGYNGTWTVVTSSSSQFTFTASQSGLSTLPAGGTASTNIATWSQVGADETGTLFGTAAQMGTCPGSSFSVGDTFKNNLLAVDEGVAPSCGTGTPSSGWTGWSTSGGSYAEGCRAGTSNVNCAENHLDASTSTVIYTDFPGRCAANYMEMGGLNAGVICSPGNTCTLTFPTSTVCPGASGQPPASCVGMSLMMNGAAFDANNANYHNYVLAPTSVYKNAADDNTDLGIGTLTEIDNAIHSTQYTCLTFCGTSGGPYPD